jgi:hypothetical protein
MTKMTVRILGALAAAALAFTSAELWQARKSWQKDAEAFYRLHGINLE